MKKGFIVWIEDDAELVAFCATVATQKQDIKGVSIVNFNKQELKECKEWYFSVDDKAKKVIDGEV